MKIPTHQATIPRGKHLGGDADLVSDNEADHFIRCPGCQAGLTAAIWDPYFTTRGRCPTQFRISCNETAA